MKVLIDYLKWLSKHFKSLKKILLKKYLMESGNAVIEIIFTLLLGLMIEAVFYQESIKIFLFYVGVFLLSFLFRFVLSLKVVNESTSLQKLISVRLRSMLYEKTIKATGRQLNEQSTGERIQIFSTDVENLFTCLDQSAQNIWLAAVRILSMILIICFYNPLLALIVLLFSIINTFLMGLTQKKYQQARKIFRQKNAQYLDWINEHLKGMKDIRANQAETMMNRLFNRETVHNLKEKEKIRFIEIKFERLMGLISMLFTILFWLVSIVMIIGGSLTLGIFYVINQYFSVLSVNMLSIGEEWAFIANSMPGLIQIREICDRDIEAEKARTEVWFKDNQAGNLCLEQIRFGYGEKLVINDLSVNFELGKMIAIVGSNGEGKTTLFNILMRFFLKQSGIIQYAGIDIEDIDLIKWRRQIGYVRQEPVIFPGSLRDNMLLYSPDVTTEKIWVCLKIACMDKTVMSWQEKLDTDLLGGTRLSEGQRQRIAIARALVRDPLIFLMDEPTATLDYENEQEIINNIQKACANKILIMITHRVAIVRQADKIIVLKDGKVLVQGKHDQLSAENSYYNDLINKNKI